jgi:hypothetical protein
MVTLVSLLALSFAAQAQDSDVHGSAVNDQN